MDTDIFDRLAVSWPSPIVARAQVGKFSGGLLHARTLANLDCLGRGPRKVSLGRKVGYDRDDLVRWMKERAGSTAANR